MLRTLWNDEVGAIVSIEIILILTIAVISLVVGWSEVAHGVNTELDDISNAVGKLNQSYLFSGFQSFKSTNGSNAIKAVYYGSAYFDRVDDCDGNCSGISQITCCAAISEQVSFQAF
jgi:Flp pilus assembly pilin Flp